MYAATTKAIGKYFEAVEALDDEIIKVAKEVKDNKKSKASLKAAAEWASEPSADRAALKAPYKAFAKQQKAADKEDQSQKREFQEDTGKDDDKKSSGSAGAVVGGVVGGVAVIGGGVGTMKYKKRGCFASNDGLEEGGERTDRSLFKKEIKSKSTHKRHAKESLVPSFKVEEEA